MRRLLAEFISQRRPQFSARVNRATQNLKQLAPSYTATAGGTAAPRKGRLAGSFEATSYHGSEPGGGGFSTATGRPVGPGVVAVDPRVIPLGTKLYVEGYGEAIAADTGGAIKGNRIDVWKPSVAAANQWGRKNVRVWILG